MTIQNSAPTRQQAAARAMWALGDLHRFSTATVWELGPRLVSACGIGPGQRVLDVAAGTGNVAIRAAEAGADVVACDLTPEHFASGRREAAARGVELEWVEADAEALPFAAGEFDVVTSSLGAIFAPDQGAVAAELLRVCRPGGTIGMINFVDSGPGGAFFSLLGRYAPPPPPGAASPLDWGDEGRIEALLGAGADVDVTLTDYVERATDARAYCELFKATFGPIVGLRAALEAEPNRLEAFDRELLEFATTWNSAAQQDGAAYRYEVLLVVARKRRGEHGRA